MGEIKSEVRRDHLMYFNKEEQFLKPFLVGFDITYGARKKTHNTELSVYLLRPEGFMVEAFGFVHEIMLVYSHYDTIEPRAMQAIESILSELPIKGRAETLNYFLVSEDKNIYERINEYTQINEETRVIITFAADDLRKNRNDTYFVRNTLMRQFFSRDLFDYKLPLVRDTYFFGRTTIVNEYLDAIKRGENRGLFGLRKTGKTSILFKLQRTLLRDGYADLFFYDCKFPAIRKLRWYQLLQRIIENICDKYELDSHGMRFDEKNISISFEKLLQLIPKNIVLAFDEIEYISFFQNRIFTGEKIFWIFGRQYGHRKVVKETSPSLSQESVRK